MTTSEAIAYFKGNVSALARAIGIDQSSVYSWLAYPPDRRQMQLQRVTGGALKAERDCIARVNGMPEPKNEKAGA